MDTHIAKQTSHGPSPVAVIFVMMLCFNNVLFRSMLFLVLHNINGASLYPLGTAGSRDQRHQSRWNIV
ncbi:hypothetical protein MOY_06300 [Halomonas sp. GFAJ-1]|nr:hypothetical protein MOY_06300 [Halomonas sp. GFAJ-1]